MPTNTQALRNISNPMSPFGDLLDCINLKVFRKSCLAHDYLLASFFKGQSVYTALENVMMPFLIDAHNVDLVKCTDRIVEVVDGGIV